MEQKRVVVVVVVAAVVILGVVGIALWQFYPKANAPTVQYIQPFKSGADPSPAASLEPSLSDSPSPNPNQDVVIIYGTNGAGNRQAKQEVQIGSGDSLASLPPDPVVVQTPASLAPSRPEPTRPPRSAPAAVVKKPKVAAAPKVQPVVEYWIQVIASSKRETVETVKQNLVGKGWNGLISTVSVNKTDWYRLRYGPFDNRAEATKFLNWIKEDPRLANSFISQETVSRPIN